MVLIELSDKQIETLLSGLEDEYDDDIILLCRYLYKKYHIEGAKYMADKQTFQEWIIENKRKEQRLGRKER